MQLLLGKAAVPHDRTYGALLTVGTSFPYIEFLPRRVSSGERALWKAFKIVAEAPARIAGTDFDALISRAEDQFS